mgnify:CR=1 FL=1
MADTHNTQMRLSTDSDPTLSIPHDELIVAYQLLRDLYRVDKDAHNAACRKWAHERELFTGAVRRMQDAQCEANMLRGDLNRMLELQRTQLETKKRRTAKKGKP